MLSKGISIFTASYQKFKPALIDTLILTENEMIPCNAKGAVQVFRKEALINPHKARHFSQELVETKADLKSVNTGQQLHACWMCKYTTVC